MREEFHGLLVVDKPGGITSRAALDRAQAWFPRGTRLGHTGTLDPLATGVLVVCVGAATRLAEYVQRMAKSYDAVLQLGVKSTTDDADGVCTPVIEAVMPEPSAVASRLQEFVGFIEQAPPAFSAAKSAGRRAYELARRGESVTLAARPVHIHAITIQNYAYPHLHVVVDCGKGTYIRALARDLGERLGCGALIASLRRTRVGPFAVGDAITLESDPALARSQLLPLATAVSELPPLVVTADELGRLRHGQRIVRADESAVPEVAAAFDVEGNLVGVVTGDQQQRSIAPLKMLARSPDKLDDR